MSGTTGGRARASAGSLCLLASLAVSACSGGEGAANEAAGDGAAAAADSGVVATITPVFQTPRDTVDNVDSPAVWHGPAGQHWLLATAKEADVIVVSDATTGEVVRRVGSQGTAPGQLDRPNGIAVMDDLMWVVERDNARVQVFRLPGFEPLGTYGEAELERPYGVAIVREGEGAYTTFVTDNYEQAEDVIPPDSLLGERVRAYHVTVGPSGASAALTQTFGEVSGDGVLRVVESIAVDPETRLLLIAEEQEGASLIKVYDTVGRFSGRTIETRFFPNQAEGIVLYRCADGGGYWIATDQGLEVNTFHVFDRKTLAHVGSFRGDAVRNTDGVALTQVGFGPFAEGAFFAVHDDGNVAALRWSDIAGALRLRADCSEGALRRGG